MNIPLITSAMNLSFSRPSVVPSPSQVLSRNKVKWSSEDDELSRGMQCSAVCELHLRMMTPVSQCHRHCHHPEFKPEVMWLVLYNLDIDFVAISHLRIYIYNTLLNGHLIMVSRTRNWDFCLQCYIINCGWILANQTACDILDEFADKHPNFSLPGICRP